MTRSYFQHRTPIRSGPYDAPPHMIKLTEDRMDWSDALFHYTSIDSFTKIIQDEMIFASNALHMNDSEELSFAVHAITGYFLENIDNESQRSLLIRYVMSVFPDFLPAEIYIFSLTRNSSQLSQWRAYAQPEGVSFGWNRKKLEEFALLTGGSLHDVVYDWDKQKALIEPLAQKIVNNIKEDWLTDFEKAQMAFKDLFAYDFGKVAPLIKHAAFSEEMEVRVLWNNTDIRSAKYFVARQSDIKPFIKINLTHNKLQIIDHIVIGPSANIHRRFYEIDKLIENSGFDWSMLTGSGIPLQRL